MSSPNELIVTSKTFNPADVSFAPAKTDSRGGKKVQLMLNGSPIVISVPFMFTWGINERVDEASGRVSYDAALVFENEKDNISKFCDKLKEMQNMILNAASSEKSKEWFGKNKLYFANFGFICRLKWSQGLNNTSKLGSSGVLWPCGIPVPTRVCSGRPLTSPSSPVLSQPVPRKRRARVPSRFKARHPVSFARSS